MRERDDLRARFEEYVAARRPALVRTAYLLCGDAHLAEDLVQGALIKAVGQWKRIGEDPEPWLRRVMVNDHISQWRRLRGRERLTEAVPEGGAPSTDRADSMTLEVALRSLAPRQRAVIVLRYYEDLTEVETARLLGVAVGTVKSQHRDAIARLRLALPELDLAGSLP